MPTHIVLSYPSQEVEMLFRASDGMALGQVEKITVIWGVDRNRGQSRVFIDHEHARRYFREVLPADDLKADGKEGPVDLEVRNCESVLIQPGQIAASWTPKPLRN